MIPENIRRLWSFIDVDESLFKLIALIVRKEFAFKLVDILFHNCTSEYPVVLQEQNLIVWVDELDQGALRSILGSKFLIFNKLSSEID